MTIMIDEFLQWFEGFKDGVDSINNSTITPKQWEILKRKLQQVADSERKIAVPPQSPSYPPISYPNNRGYHFGDYLRSYPMCATTAGAIGSAVDSHEGSLIVKAKQDAVDRAIERASKRKW